MHYGTMMRGVALSCAVLGGAIVADADAGKGEDLERARGYFREVDTLCSADGGQLWGVSLAGPMMFVDPATRAMFANQADAEGHLKPEGDIFVGTLPENVPVANTALEWAGTRWTQLMWPLSKDDVDRHVILMHESWHRIQDQIGLPAASPDNRHLNTFDGRFWVQLEWRALERALRTSGEDRRSAIEDALLFRRERHRLFASASAAEQERALEAAEGLAEYTGIRLSGMTAEERLAYAARQLAERPAQFPTFNRSFAYLTGPAYALLLDTTDQPWRTGLTADADLGQRLQDALGMKLPDADADELARRAARYDGDALRKTELDREQARQARHTALKKQFFEDAVLTLPLDKMQITFDPRNIETVGELGTYYPTLIISDRWGKLAAKQGAFLAPDFKSVKVVAPADPKASAPSGPGWTLELDPGWQIVDDQRSGHYRVAPRPAGTDK
jgi:hypothetical protein